MSLVTRVRADQLVDRIVATYYRREFVDNEERLARSPIRRLPLSELVTAGRRAVYFGTTTLERDEASSDWIPFLTSDDIDDSGCSINLDARRRVSPEFADRYPNGVLRANELLVKVKGPNQTTAYQESLPTRRIQVSGTIWGSLVRKDRVDPHYLVAVLSSPYAALARTRLRTNLNVEFLSPDDLQTVVLPVPVESKAQTYIGDKLRQAERLRERARALECDFRRPIADAVPLIFGLIQERGRLSRVSATELDGRLNPGLFNPERLRIRRYLQENGGRLVSSLATIETPATSEYRLKDPYLGLDGISSSSSMLSVGSVADDEVTGTVRVLPEGPALAKLRPYLNKVCYVPQEYAGCFGSTELLCVRPQAGVSGWYIYGVLKLESTVRQLNPVSTGSTHPRVGREDVLEVMVPWHEDHVRLGAYLATAQRFYLLAQRLTTAAKFLVEALIEGKVTEAEQKDAQEALQRGDSSFDRAILQRLTRNGIDVPTEPPLFPNLDDLYATLEESADASVTVEARG